MANLTYQNQKMCLRYSKNAIDNAARKIRQGCSDEERIEAIKAIQNFREIHMYPLMLLKNHLARAAKYLDKEIIVARRLKRLATIIDKLERPTLDGKSQNSIRLTRMQDIGGCRAIVKNSDQLRKLHEKLIKSKSAHRIIHTSDYLSPKESGYGGIHLIYSCFENTKDENEWKKTKIEVQLRTKLQHAWATSLEIIDTLEQMNLKTSINGNDDWREFFSIAGKLVAHDDGFILIENENLTTYQSRLKILEKQLNAMGKLVRFSFGIKAATAENNPYLKKKNIGMCLIILEKTEIDNTKEEKPKHKLKLKVKAFKVNETHKAVEALNRSELDKNIFLSVLLSTSDAKNLKKAYPNYFGSSSDFTNFIKKHTR